MDLRREPAHKQKDVDKLNSTAQLLKLVDNNEIIFHQLKQQLMGQLDSYKAALFSRQNDKQTIRKYIQDRDFDNFKYCSDIFKKKGQGFITRLSMIKNNCCKVIKNLPQQQKIIPSQSNNGFDMFLDQQIQISLQQRMRSLKYEKQSQKPFQKPFESFLD